MQTQLNQPTQAPLPVTQIQIPQNQNVGNINLAENKRTKCLKKVVFILGITTISLSALVIVMSFAEVLIQPCRYNYCYSNTSMAAGIWGSIFPLIAGIFGVIAGSKSSSKCKIKLLMAFTITGAVMSYVFIQVQSYLYLRYLWEIYHTPFKYGLQIAIMCFASINFVILIISSAFSCCLLKYCCCGGSQGPESQQVLYSYVPYDPKQQVTNQQIQGNVNYAQGSQLVFLNQPQQQKQQQLLTNYQPNQQQLVTNFQPFQQQLMTNFQPDQQQLMTEVQPSQQVSKSSSMTNQLSSEPPQYNHLNSENTM